MFDPAILRCYFVAGTQDIHHSPSALLAKVTTALKNGITAFQFREKGSSHLDDTAKIELGGQLKRLCQSYGVPLFVDDDVPLAQQIHADGVHVGQKDQQVEQVLSAVGSQMMVGYSCNTSEQVEHANKLAVDYIGVGPIYPTDSKADADPAIGPQQLQKLVQLSKHPVVAIGGINNQNLGEVANTNCAGAAVISYLANNNNLREAIDQMKTAFEH